VTKRVIITGGAGFIGSNLCEFLLNQNWEVFCIDNFDDYYSPEIKMNNLNYAHTQSKFSFIESDIKDFDWRKSNLSGNFDALIHLAAKAGVRYSLQYPIGYKESNVEGTINALMLAKELQIKQFVFASSSSIYSNSPIPFREDYNNLNPSSPYAQTKLFSERIGREFSEKHGIRFISLRFFSVYGPRLRPDLVMNKIAESLYLKHPLKIFGDGSAARDYTYVDDIIQGIIKAVNYIDTNFEIFNLGNGNPITLSDIINIFELQSKTKTNIEYIDSIKGESDITWADNSKAKEILGFTPKIDIYSGVKKFLEWYHERLK
jgi:UDP-glucuronate 4-epimerase